MVFSLSFVTRQVSINVCNICLISQKDSSACQIHKLFRKYPFLNMTDSVFRNKCMAYARYYWTESRHSDIARPASQAYAQARDMF